MKPLNRKTALVNSPGKIKVLQFGGGNFLRGFTDWMIDVMNERLNFEAYIQIFQSHTKGGPDLINQQEGLYHLTLVDQKKGILKKETRLITSVSNAINPHENHNEFLKSIENPDISLLISNTTEAGIIFKDEQLIENKTPETFPGKLTMLLWYRFRYNNEDLKSKIVILPCELISNNGKQLRQIVFKYIDHWKLSKELKDWIDDTVIFCNTLVDRIVPGFPADNINEFQKETGYEDNLLVVAEHYHLWVIEAPEEVSSIFPADKAGLNVKFVSDLAPYHIRKVRILNGAHTAMVPLSYLKGFRTVKEAVEDPDVNKFLKKAIFEEIIPTIKMEALELREYADDVLARFKNPGIKHELLSIALNSLSKFKVRVIPSILEFYKIQKHLPENLIISFAALIVFYKGKWRGEDIPLKDSQENINFFKSVWQLESVKEMVNEVLSNSNLWEQDLGLIEGLEDQLSEAIEEVLLLEAKY